MQNGLQGTRQIDTGGRREICAALRKFHKFCSRILNFCVYLLHPVCRHHCITFRSETICLAFATTPRACIYHVSQNTANTNNISRFAVKRTNGSIVVLLPPQVSPPFLGCKWKKKSTCLYPTRSRWQDHGKSRVAARANKWKNQNPLFLWFT